jgi:hypothetical protein
MEADKCPIKYQSQQPGTSQASTSAPSSLSPYAGYTAEQWLKRLRLVLENLKKGKQIIVESE